MTLSTSQPDPLGILASTKYVLENAKDVELVPDNVSKLVTLVEQKLVDGLPSGEDQFGNLDSLEIQAQFALVIDSVNFCFWAEKGKTKWQTEWPKGNSLGGGFGLNASFQRALANNIPILNADYLSEITLDQVKSLFFTSNDAEIPLLQKRQENLQEVGRVLKQKYQGKFLNLIISCEFDGIKILKTLVHDFPSYNDISIYEDQEIRFYKRAQLGVCDLSLFKASKITGIDQLTAFADYKIPQVFRELGLIKYSTDLSEKIDTYTLIPAGSKPETEIRSATVWCIELIRQKLDKYTAAQIDNAVWYLSQDQLDPHPFHRAYTIFY